MRIIIVSPYDLDTSGGVQAQALGLEVGLTKRGHSVTAVGPKHVRNIRANGSVAPISLSRRDWSHVQSIVSESDVVHVHEPFMPVVSWAALKASRPTVATFHADPSRLVRLAYTAAGSVLRRSLGDAFVAAVSPVAASAIAKFANPVLIPNGIHLPSAQYDKVRGSLVFLGRDDPRKGLDVLLAAWPGIARRHSHAQLTVVGIVDRPAIEGVTFAGFVNEAEKERILGRSQIMIAPQTSGESFGITVAEGMAAGCLVVASDLPAFRFVTDGLGRIFRAGDRDQLSSVVGDVLDRLVIDPQPIRQSSQRFSWEYVLDAYEEAYRSVT